MALKYSAAAILNRLDRNPVDYHSCPISLEIGSVSSLIMVFFTILLDILDSLTFDVKFGISLSISTK